MRTEEVVAVIQELRQVYKLKDLLQLAGMVKSTFFYQLMRKKQSDKDAGMKKIIQEIFHKYKSR